jgi:hypothetical protein
MDGPIKIQTVMTFFSFPCCWRCSLLLKPEYVILHCHQNSKIELMLPCDEDPHIIYRWKKHEEDNTMRWKIHEMVEWFGRNLKEKFLIQKWNRAIWAIIDQIDTSNTFSMVPRDCLRAWLNFKSFKLVIPRTHKSGPKLSWSNSISEHSIDWIKIN